jgi:hypothetical protein
MRPKHSWRILTLSVAGVSLLIVASLNFAGAQPNTSGNRAASAPRVHTPTRRTGKLAGIVDLAKTPKLTPGAQTPATIAPLGSGDPLTPEQRQAYEKSVRANPQVKNPHPNTRSGDGKSPAFVGGGVTPLVTKNVDGLTSAQANGVNFPGPALREWPATGPATLRTLDLRGNTWVRELPSWLRQMDEMNIAGCRNLERLPEKLRVASWLDLASAGLRRLPPSARGLRLRWRAD